MIYRMPGTYVKLFWVIIYYFFSVPVFAKRIHCHPLKSKSLITIKNLTKLNTIRFYNWYNRYSGPTSTYKYEVCIN